MGSIPIFLMSLRPGWLTDFPADSCATMRCSSSTSRGRLWSAPGLAAVVARRATRVVLAQLDPTARAYFRSAFWYRFTYVPDAPFFMSAMLISFGLLDTSGAM